LKVLVIVPTYNEISNISELLKKIQNISVKVDILIIDDSSPDKTAEVVKNHPDFEKSIFLIKREKKLGLGTAYVMGFQWSLANSYDYTFSMDCDFSHDCREIPRMIKKMQTADLIIGSRYIDGIRVINWPISRLLLSYCASVLVRFVLRLPVKDSTGGYNCYSKKTLSAIALDEVFSIGYAFQIEMKFRIFNKNLICKEHPIIFYERRNGESKLASAVIWEGLFNLLKLKYFKLIKVI
jgi:dolichol-phosphate mannosyltransferase